MNKKIKLVKRALNGTVVGFVEFEKKEETTLPVVAYSEDKIKKAFWKTFHTTVQHRIITNQRIVSGKILKRTWKRRLSNVSNNHSSSNIYFG